MADLPITRLSSLQIEVTTLQQVANLAALAGTGGTLNGTIFQSPVDAAPRTFATYIYDGDVLQENGIWDKAAGQLKIITLGVAVNLPAPIILN